MFGGRQVKGDGKPKDIPKNDEARFAAVRKLLEEGKIQSSRDYFYAALIFQHSSTGTDLILAHVLAVTSVGKGLSDAKWMAAASLDRYLKAVGRPQAFGTQVFKTPEGEWTMEPYDRTALSDSIRATWCVVPLAEQAGIVQAVREGKPFSTQIQNCK